jgi:hypothetical protein
VADRLGDVLAFTSGYQLPTGPVGLLDAPAPNLIRFTFTDPRARLAYPDWDHVADAHLRADFGPNFVITVAGTAPQRRTRRSRRGGWIVVVCCC